MFWRATCSVLVVVSLSVGQNALSKRTLRILEIMSHKAKLLIVDDDEWIRDILHHTLQGTHDVFVAANGFDALTLKEEHEIRIILTDIQMPGMSGLELGEKIRNNDLDSFLYAMTGRPDLFTAAHCSKLGFNGCFSKPFELSEIENAVERAVQMLQERDARANKSSCKPQPGHHPGSDRHHLTSTHS